FFIMREALKSALRFASAPAWAGYVISPVGVNFSSSDAELDAFIRVNAGTVFHPAGSAGMSSKDANSGVVDPDLRVKGLTGLRIVDLSVVPFIPAAHTQAAAYIIAERAADLIKASWGQ
ncbi:glucose-methanol-choline oxidoreductase, partial [Mycena rosella]